MIQDTGVFAEDIGGQDLEKAELSGDDVDQEDMKVDLQESIKLSNEETKEIPKKQGEKTLEERIEDK